MLRDHVGETAFAGYATGDMGNFGDSSFLDSDDEGDFNDIVRLKEEVSFHSSRN